jgi:Restriction endonuclease
MHSSSKAFERQVSRIYELLACSNECVTWDDRIPDPDNPEQLRQIDVTVRHGAILTLIECRLRRIPQDVTWVEELIGRRESMGAQAIIGVSSAGFTEGAKRKADHFGVVLHDLRRLTDEDISGWGRQVSLKLYYYQYFEVTLGLGFSRESIPKLEPNKVAQELRSHHLDMLLVQSAFNASATWLGEHKLLASNDAQKYQFGVRLQPEATVHICGEQVLEISLEGQACLANQSISSHMVFKYGQPAQETAERDVTVQQFSMGETSIVHHNDRIAINVDLLKRQLPPLSQLRFFQTISEQELEHEIFSITDSGCLRVTGSFRVVPYSFGPQVTAAGRA